MNLGKARFGAQFGEESPSIDDCKTHVQEASLVGPAGSVADDRRQRIDR